MDKKIEEHLAIMLENYEQSLKGVTEYIKTTTEQLEGARTAKADMEGKVADLKELLGLEDEADTEEPSLSLVE